MRERFFLGSGSKQTSPENTNNSRPESPDTSQEKSRCQATNNRLGGKIEARTCEC